MKYYRFSVEYILYDLSYTNLILLSATIPEYKSKADEEGGKGQTIDASNPENNALIARFLG